MPVLALLRHGPTEWTARRRLQGRSDLALSESGRRLVAGWRLPDSVARTEWITSPLLRCRETAEILHHAHAGAPAARVEPRLTETSFGDWEGRSLSELRAIHGAAMAEWECRGLDFRAPGGESPRDVQARLSPWLAEVAAGTHSVLGIAHKGIIRAVYALATGWDMRDKPRTRLLDNAVHTFILDAVAIRIGTLNIPLSPDEPAAEAR